MDLLWIMIRIQGVRKLGLKVLSYDDDDFFGLNTKNDDGFGLFASPPKHSDSVDDLLGDFGRAELKLKSLKENVAGFDDLIPGFGASSSPNNGANAKAAKSTFMSSEDPFVVFESTSNPQYSSTDSFTDPLDELGKISQFGGRKSEASPKASTPLKPPLKPANKGQSPIVSSIDELEDFAMGGERNSVGENSIWDTKEMREPYNAKVSKYKESKDAARKTQENSVDDLESLFSVGSRSSSVPRSRPKTLDLVYDVKNNKGSDVT